MVGEHVTLGGEADAETELDVREARDEIGDGQSRARAACTLRPATATTTSCIGKRYGLEIYCPVDNAGRFLAEVEHFAGERVFEANPKIVEFMRERGVLLFGENYEHRYPHCWRCKNPVIFRATPQWFISMDRRSRGSVEVETDDDGRDRSELHRERSVRARIIARHARCARSSEVEWIPAWGVGRMRNMLKGPTRLVRLAATRVGRADPGLLLCGLQRGGR